MQSPSIRNLKNNLTRFIFGQSSLYQSFGKMQSGEVTLQSQYENTDSFKGLFFRMIEIRANAMTKGMSDVQVQRETGQGEMQSVERSHPWVALLRRPNQTLSARMVWKWMYTNIDLIGHADLYVVKNGIGIPESLLPIFKEFGDVYPVPDALGGVGGWKFWRSDGERKTFEADEVIRIQRPSPLTPYESFSLVEAAIYQLDVDYYMKSYRRESVDKGGLTSVVLTSDQSVNRDQRKELGQEFKQYMGRKGLDKVFVGSQGLKPVSFAMSARDLDYIQGEVQNWQQLAFICGIPDGKFAKDANRANADAAERNFISDTIQPEMDNAADQLTLGFERAFGADPGVLSIESPDLMPLDQELMMKERESQLRTGQRTINELRAEDGRDPVEGGDVPMVSGVLMPVTQITPQQRSVKKKSMKRAYTAEQLDALWRSVDQRKRREEAATLQVVRKLFEGWRQMVQDNLDKKRSFTRADEPVLTADELFSMAQAQQDMNDELRAEVIRLLKSGFDHGSTLAQAEGLQFSMNSHQARNAIEDIMSNSKSIAETTMQQINDLVQESLKKGDAISDISSKIDSLFDEINAGRAQTVAQTTATGGFEAGQDAAYSEAGITQKQWLSQRDSRVRASHASADGQKVDRNGAFDVGGANLSYPGDPNGPAGEVINCRCSTLPVLSEDD